MGWGGEGAEKVELPVGQTQRPENHRFHYYTSTRAIKDFLRILDSLPIIYRKSQIYLFL